MTDFNEEIFPYQFECSCGNETEVTHRDVTDRAFHASTPREAVNYVLRSRGWWEVDGRRICPECAEDLK